MMFEVEFGRRTRSVSIERAGGADTYRVTIDGRPHVIDGRRAGECALLLVVGALPPKPTAAWADKSQDDTKLAGGQAVTSEVFVTPTGTADEVLVTLDGRTAVVTVNGRQTGRAAAPKRYAHGEQPVVAPMPGRVVRVLVAPGDEVAASQGVVVVEAMKMENELRAPKGGRVKDVSVSPGTSVEAGRVLVVIE